MQIKTVLRLLGIFLMLFSVSMLTPLSINFIFHEACAQPFMLAFICTFLTGCNLWLLFRHQKADLKIRDGFLLVALFWFVLCGFGALPFLLIIQQNHHYITNAIFESVSGFTTTGASIIKNIHTLPNAALFYRQQLQFLGGMGMVVLAVAILPMLGVGGMQLYRAETPGPMKESKLTPRIAHTAKTLWSIYCLLTIGCMLCYWVAGMSWFEALGESFSTVSTGGFSMHNNSFAYYHSTAIELIACCFMLIGSSNFALHYLAFIKKDVRCYAADEEFRHYLSVILGFITVVSLVLILANNYASHHMAIVKSAFHIISFATTTGFTSTEVAYWPACIPIAMILLGIIGGCGGSTSGGIKAVRALLLIKQSKQEIKRLIHPHAVISLKFGQQPLSEQVLQSVWAFISVFIALFFVIMLLLMAFGNDFLSAFSATIASIANLGAGFGNIQQDFAQLNMASKWILIFAMIAGRLEIFSLLILFSRHFWEK